MLELFIDDKKYNSFINYAISTCDSLSLVFEKDEMISSEYIFQELYYQISDFVIEEKSVGIHPDTGTEFSDCDYISVFCCKEIKAILMQLGSIYCCNGKEFPEELCFYRENKKWFVFISHEKLLFLHNETKEDIQFLNDEKIKYYVVD